MKIVLVIPTYNEKSNIGQLIPELYTQFAKFPHHDFNVLVVDGNSPDGTAVFVQELAQTYAGLSVLLEQKKAGLGAAYIYGFKHAISVLQADAVVEMDADLQHRPSDFSKMLEAYDQGYDYVLGSRYIKGGSIPKDWPFYRKFLSVGGNIFTKIVLGIYNVNDFTTGFKISRVKGFLDNIDFSQVNSAGFAYKMDLLYRMHRLGAKIKEVPITFELRSSGNSKMENDNALDSLRVVLALKYSQNKNFFKFLIVGVLGLIADNGSFNLLRLTVLSSRSSSAISGVLGITTTFLLNNYWSFKERKLEGIQKKILSFTVYFISSSIPISFRTWLVGYAVHTFGDSFIISNIAFFIGIVVGLLWNYSVYSKLIWKSKK